MKEVKRRVDRLNISNKETIEGKRELIPTTTVELLELLDKWYIDKLETNSEFVGTPEYWKKAGIIELKHRIREILSRQS